MLNHCGFPCNSDSRDTAKCPLAATWGAAAVPDDLQRALCASPTNATVTGGCDSYDKLKKLDELMQDK